MNEKFTYFIFILRHFGIRIRIDIGIGNCLLEILLSV